MLNFVPATKKRGLHWTAYAALRQPISKALKALLRCSLVGCLAAILVAAGRQKTALSLATVLAANLAFRSRGNPAHSSGIFRPLGVLVPGAIGQAGTSYRGVGIQHWVPE